jgi:hypothetical protein
MVHVPYGTEKERRLMDKLHVEAEQTAEAAPAIVWALVSDATTYPRWGPWRVYPQIVADLASAAEKQAAPVRG